MTVQEWKSLALGITQDPVMRQHLDKLPTLEAEVMWLVNNLLSKAAPPPPRKPGELRADEAPRYHTLKFTDQQRTTFLLVLQELFAGRFTLNPATGALFPVSGKPLHPDKGHALAPNSIAKEPKP